VAWTTSGRSTSSQQAGEAARGSCGKADSYPPESANRKGVSNMAAPRFMPPPILSASGSCRSCDPLGLIPSCDQKHHTTKNPVTPAVRQAVRQAHGPEQGRRTKAGVQSFFLSIPLFLDSGFFRKCLWLTTGRFLERVARTTLSSGSAVVTPKAERRRTRGLPRRFGNLPCAQPREIAGPGIALLCAFGAGATPRKARHMIM